MIKKQQKWVALLVLVTFAWLLQVSTMPLRASEAAAPFVSASSETGPDYYEAVAQKAAPAKKKSILPLVLIGVGLVAVTAVLFLVVLKTKYDVVGTWDFIFTRGSTSIPHTLTFSGTKANGNYTTAGNPLLAGSYTVDDKNVTLTVNSAPYIRFAGQFTNKDTMNGTYVEGSSDYTWTATRVATAASTKPIALADGTLPTK